MKMFPLSALYPVTKKRKQELEEFNTKYNTEMKPPLKDTLMKDKNKYQKELDIFKETHLRYGTVEDDIAKGILKEDLTQISMDKIIEDEKKLIELRTRAANKFSMLEAEAKKTRLQLTFGLTPLEPTQIGAIKLPKNSIQLVQEKGNNKWYAVVSTEKGQVAINVADSNSDQVVKNIQGLEHLDLKKLREKLESSSLEKISKEFKLKEEITQIIQKPPTEEEKLAKMRAGVYSYLLGSLGLVKLVRLRQDLLEQLGIMERGFSSPNLKKIIPLLRENTLVTLGAFNAAQWKALEQDEQIKQLLLERNKELAKEGRLQDPETLGDITNRIEAHIKNFMSLQILNRAVEQLEKAGHKIDAKQKEKITKGLTSKLLLLGVEYLAKNQNQITKGLVDLLLDNRTAASKKGLRGLGGGGTFVISTDSVSEIANKLPALKERGFKNTSGAKRSAPAKPTTQMVKELEKKKSEEKKQRPLKVRETGKKESRQYGPMSKNILPVNIPKEEAKEQALKTVKKTR